MLEEVTSLLGLQVYTNFGVFIGIVNNVIVDLNKHCADSLYVEEPNPTLVEASRSVTIPYRWVQNVGDIILLKHFPERVELTEEQRRQMEFEAQQMEMQGMPEE